jgi:hypothetical protein
VAAADRGDQLGDAPLPRLGALGVLDGPHVLAFEAIGQPVERGAGLGARSSASARSGGSAATRGSASSRRPTSTTSPSAIPLAARLAALMPTINRPPMDATRLRQV